MDIRTDVSLKPYLTMQLGGNAHTMVDLYTNDDVVAVCTMARQQQAELFVLGGGSNTLAQDSGFAGIVARNRIPGFSLLLRMMSRRRLPLAQEKFSILL